MAADDRPLVWLSGEVKSPPFSSSARIEAGVLLRRLQRGESIGMPFSRPMPIIGRGCHELRVVDQSASWRILYFIDSEAIVILDVFSKKSSTTPKEVIRRARRRLRLYLKVLEE